MGKTRFEYAHGKRIEVIDITPELQARKPRQKRARPDGDVAGGDFTKSYRKHTALLRQAKVSAAVWNVYDEITWLHFKAWHKDKPLKFSNRALDDLGISHDTKLRALKRLEKLGIVRIERWQNGSSPFVTLLI